ncbi:VOC family protein [Sphingomonas colocasiae]|uniref:VOC family protein n=1 Tax=Sphingomonas colocasiae TaxID=1848973 RepID=A0ABS7PQG1_9SPHN|nr:VOC family protein [Sphingomonas colocasiae]MBY8823570.1 VOC family protein [Sphingomonas colocasiae]
MATSLAYLRLQSTRIDDWAEFADLLGCGVSRRDAGLALRLDEAAYRILIDEGGADDLRSLGFLTDDAGRAGALAKLGGAAAEGDDGILRFADPDGVEIELVAALEANATPFHSARLAQGFVADGSGFGHALLKVADMDRSVAFYTHVLGGALSDHILLGDDGGTARIAFVHFNERHHSLALMEGGIGSQRRLQHFMLELRSLEDLGRTYDRMIDSRFGIAATLGQHSNDRSLSFYSATPSGLWVEIGCGSIRIEDEAAWRTAEYRSTSLWGHRPPPPRDR